jgi:micrococcal nuclease
MNKAFLKIVCLIVLSCMLISVFTGCDTAGNDGTTPSGTQPGQNNQPTEGKIEEKDYAASVKLDMNSDSLKAEATVSSYVDGDTTWFNVDKSVMGTAEVKTRYIAINTPESTGTIEEWGKAASNFTREKLSGAVSIILESDDSNWNIDSTGTRYLVWVWYKTSEDGEYRNLNIEILQNGLAIASNSNNNRYGDICMNAIAQARALKYHVYSGQKDPDFYYGGAIELDLKELRTHIEDYAGKTVAFSGVITKNANNTCYVESYDVETDMYYGMTVYYGYGLSAAGLSILNVGNEVRIVGSVQFYEGGGSWQVSDLEYRAMKPNDPNNIQKLSEGHAPAYRVTDPNTFLNSTVEIVTEEGEAESYTYAELALGSSVRMENLRVVDAYTTLDEESSSNGAITLYCEAADGTRIAVRTMVLRDAEGNILTQDQFLDKTINVNGIVDFYSNNYQIKVFTSNDLEVVG